MFDKKTILARLTGKRQTRVFLKINRSSELQSVARAGGKTSADKAEIKSLIVSYSVVSAVLKLELSGIEPKIVRHRAGPLRAELNLPLIFLTSEVPPERNERRGKTNFGIFKDVVVNAEKRCVLFFGRKCGALKPVKLIGDLEIKLSFIRLRSHHP